MYSLLITIFSRNKKNSPAVREDVRRTVRTSLSALLETFLPTLGLEDGQKFTSISNDRVYQLQVPLQGQVPDCTKLRHADSVQQLEHQFDLEIIFDVFRGENKPSGPMKRPINLALFDMDSTLIQEEVIDELARSIGKTDAVSAITARAMNGEIDFATSLRERVGMLRGVNTSVWQDLRKTVTITTGARELIDGLREKGAITGVVSGGFLPMAEWLKSELGLDYAFANHLLEAPSTPSHPYPHLTGALSPDHPIVTPELKRETLLSLAKQHNVALSSTMAVGDGSNDLLMLHTAGLGIAFNAKPKVQETAPMRLNGDSLADILYLL